MTASEQRSIAERMQSDLKSAMKQRHQPAVTALRTALAAIANAEAPSTDGRVTEVHGRLTDVPRLVLSVGDVEAIVQHEIDDRQDTIDQIAPHGRALEVDELRAEMDVLRRYLD